MFPATKTGFAIIKRLDLSEHKGAKMRSRDDLQRPNRSYPFFFYILVYTSLLDVKRAKSLKFRMKTFYLFIYCSTREILYLK